MSNLNSNAQRMEDIIEGKQKKTAPKYVGIIIALVLLAACSFGAYSFGQSSGHTAGYDEGYSTGCEEGRKAGNKEGYSTGHDEGYDVGYGDGYDAGYDDGLTGVEQRCQAFARCLQSRKSERIRPSLRHCYRPSRCRPSRKAR